MFTGIIESLGKVESVQSVGGDVRLRIGTALDMSDVHLGDSIAANGICLTVVEWGENWYAADVSRESLNRTTLGHWKVGQRVNVEKAMLPTTRFGGHIVSGHVDAVGEITVVREDAFLLYGFLREAERALFRNLLKITGVGAKLALAILSGMSAQEFADAVQRNDVSTLIRLPGIGRKTAERLSIEMRDRLGGLESAPLPGAAGAISRNALDEAISALESLGYKPVEAARMARAVPDAAGLEAGEIIRAALKQAVK